MKLANGLWALAVLVAFVAVAYPPLMILAGLVALAALKAGPNETAVDR